jgi:sugar-specific transcriptional regulator TrmB
MPYLLIIFVTLFATKISLCYSIHMEKEELLIKLGLSEDESKIYLALIGSGYLPARMLAKRTGIGRTLVYRAITRLLAHGLIEKRERKGEIAQFYPAHPRRLEELLRQKENGLISVKKSLSDTIGSFAAEYNSLIGKPNVLFYEGQEGLQKMYDDIIDTGENLYLIRSPYDKETDETRELINKQILRQFKNGIKVKALTPFTPTTAKSIKGIKPNTPTVNRVIIPSHFDIPAQVLMYGNKVAIVSLKKSLMTTIIENDDISETFKILFEKIWDLSKPESDKIKEKIELGHI